MSIQTIKQQILILKISAESLLMANPGKTDYALGIKYFPKLVSIAHKVKSNIQNYPSTLSLNERENVWLKKDMIKKKGGGITQDACLLKNISPLKVFKIKPNGVYKNGKALIVEIWKGFLKQDTCNNQ